MAPCAGSRAWAMVGTRAGRTRDVPPGRRHRAPLTGRRRGARDRRISRFGIPIPDRRRPQGRGGHELDPRRHTLNGSPAQIAEELRGFAALGCGHVALEVSYSTFPAILETIDLIAEQVRPKLAS